MKDLPLGGSTTCRRESVEPTENVGLRIGVVVLDIFITLIIVLMVGPI